MVSSKQGTRRRFRLCEKRSTLCRRFRQHEVSRSVSSQHRDSASRCAGVTTMFLAHSGEMTPACCAHKKRVSFLLTHPSYATTSIYSDSKQTQTTPLATRALHRSSFEPCACVLGRSWLPFKDPSEPPYSYVCASITQSFIPRRHTASKRKLQTGSCDRDEVYTHGGTQTHVVPIMSDHRLTHRTLCH